MSMQSKPSLALSWSSLLALVLPVLLVSGCRKSSGSAAASPPPLDGDALSYAEEIPGSDANVVRLTTPKVTDPIARTIEIKLVVTDLANTDLVGIGFDLKLESSINARFNGFTASTTSSLVAHASTYSNSLGVQNLQHIVVGLTCKGRTDRLKAKEKDKVIEIGTLSIRVDAPGDVQIKVLMSQAPGADAPRAGAGLVPQGKLLLQVQGPSLRGGLLVLPAATG